MGVGPPLVGGRHPAAAAAVAVDPIDLAGGHHPVAVATVAVVTVAVDPIEMKLIDRGIGSEEHQGTTAGHQEVEAHQAEEGRLEEGVHQAVILPTTKTYMTTTKRILILTAMGLAPRIPVCQIVTKRMEKDLKNTIVR
jgi:hypothetical protein